ncbi:MAG: molybdopterin-dependent oxidoreductase [Mogibacterium sp.]|nr:molybdopterin-dependent oxidoreductase [Mogibacterium sp.]
MKKIICISCMIALCICILAGCKQDTTEETLVTLVWNGNRTEVRTSQWKDRSVEISTEDVSLGNGKIYDFVGVKLSDLMEIAGAEDCTKAIVKASDDYSVEVAAEDIRNYEIALVNRYSGGKKIPDDAGGPVKLVYPVTFHPELRDTYDTWSWCWYVYEVEFIGPDE